MKMLTNVLLGTVAGFVMVTGAHAADMGDKEPVQFVKICARDGHSYYYIPGNDVCTQNGLSLTIGTEERRSNSLMNLSAGGVPKFGDQPNSPQSAWPEPLVSLRTDQAWGYGALVGGAHNLGAYTGDNSGLGNNSTLNGFTACLQAGAIDCSRPRDKAGFFVGLGGELKLPIFGAGDRIGAGVRFSQGGSSGFGSGLNLSSPDLFGANNTAAAAWPDQNPGLELTSAWSVQANYDHQWSSNLNTSLFAAYSNMNYDADTTSYFAGAGCAAAASAGLNCKSSWGNVGAGVRTSWAPASGLTLSVQTMYNYLWTGAAGSSSGFGSATVPRPTESYNFANQGVWSSYLRINRTFNTGD
jgi:hypothetical protein